MPKEQKQINNDITLYLYQMRPRHFKTIVLYCYTVAVLPSNTLVTLQLRVISMRPKGIKGVGHERD